MRKVCPIRYPKFGGAARRRFCTISEKPQGGGVAPTPPTWARVKAFLDVVSAETGNCEPGTPFWLSQLKSNVKVGGSL